MTAEVTEASSRPGRRNPAAAEQGIMAPAQNELNLPAPVPGGYASAVAEGRRLVGNLSRSKWGLGDLLLRVCGPPLGHGGDRSTGPGRLPPLEDFAAEIGLSEDQASVYRVVAAAFSPSARNLDIAWTVYRDSLRLDWLSDEERLELLRGRAWSVRDFRGHLRELVDAHLRHSHEQERIASEQECAARNERLSELNRDWAKAQRRATLDGAIELMPAVAGSDDDASPISDDVLAERQEARVARRLAREKACEGARQLWNMALRRVSDSVADAVQRFERLTDCCTEDEVDRALLELREAREAVNAVFDRLLSPSRGGADD